MTGFTLDLALFNFLPVLLTAAGLVLLTRLVALAGPAADAPGMLGGARRWAWAGLALVLAGGLAKALWKLIATVSGADVGWLAVLLFPLIGPGFVLLAAALWGAGRVLTGRPALTWPPRLALVLIVAAGVAALVRVLLLDVPRGWFVPLLALTTVGNLALSVLLIGLALRLRQWGGALLLAVNLGMVFALQPIAMAAPKTVALHWLEQSLTAAGTGCFALGVGLVLRQARRRAGAGRPVVRAHPA